MSALTVNIDGLPVPQGSLVSNGFGKGLRHSNHAKLKPWRYTVVSAILGAKPKDWDPSLPMSVSVVFRFKRPATHIGKKGLKPSSPQHCTSARAGDLDKLLRSTFDSLTGVVFDDDRQVVTVNASKRYCITDEPQGAIITISLISL